MQIASYRATMIFIAGLGNPGEKFKNTRHNVGFLVVDEFQKGNDFPDFFMSKKFGAETSEGILNDEKIVLVKPQTFMNESGKAVKKIIEEIAPKYKDRQGGYTRIIKLGYRSSDSAEKVKIEFV